MSARISYPWSAVVGQDLLKQALLLCAIEPALGGVLIEGPRGMAKTTLARALSELTLGPFVELPLGATEERVVGTLDLEAALREQRVVFSPGLLARAHGGVLYVDEVNLLPDALVDVVLDAAASGRNHVERDAISHTHEARFVLVGTMNPEEGELRPQLLDRFGLCVRQFPVLTVAQRAEIVRRRLAFDADPSAFVQLYAAEQRALIERCGQARARLPALGLDTALLERVSERCHAARVEGVRADLALLRAARAHAAWHGQSSITERDLDAVAELALVHRRGKVPPAPPPARGGAPPPGAPPRAGEGPGGRSSDPASAGDRGALAPVPVRAAEPPRLPPAIAGLPSQRAANQHRGSPQLTAASGARARGVATSGSVDWVQTLLRQPRPSRDQLVRRARKAAAHQLWVLVLDCSSSMLRSGALALAKGCARAFELRARRVGAHVAVISFQGTAARTEVSSRAGRSVVAEGIAALGGGGGTPLRAALRQARQLCESPSFRTAATAKRVVLFTDGRTREPVSDLAQTRAEWLVIDCELGPVRLGRAAQLAATLHGSCQQLADFQ